MNNDQLMINLSFIEAAKIGDLQTLHDLLPQADPKHENSLALRLAASNNHLQCVQFLVGVSNPKAHKSSSLQWALVVRSQEMFDVLYPVSDAKDAIKPLLGRDEFAYAIDFFNEGVARHEKHHIEEHLPDKHPRLSKKM